MYIIEIISNSSATLMLPLSKSISGLYSTLHELFKHCGLFFLIKAVHPAHNPKKG